MKMVPFNSTTLGITSMIGDSIRIDSINIIVGSTAFNASGISDDNSNGMWDPGETIYLSGLDLTRPTGVVVSANTLVLMPSTVQCYNNQYSQAPPSTGGSGGSPPTSYVPGLHMTTYSELAFANPVGVDIADNVSYASAASGYGPIDSAWPMSAAGKAHNFSVKFEGYLEIPEDDTYDFQIMASDSVYIAVDGSRIVNAAGSHGPTSYLNTMPLNVGFHTIEIGYQNYDHDAVIGVFNIRKVSEGTWREPLLRYIENTDA